MEQHQHGLCSSACLTLAHALCAEGPAAAVHAVYKQLKLAHQPGSKVESAAVFLDASCRMTMLTWCDAASGVCHWIQHRVYVGL